MDDAVVIQQYYNLRSCEKVAQLYGCSGETIRRLLKKNGVCLTGWKCEKKPSVKRVKSEQPKRSHHKGKYAPTSYNVLCKCCGKEFVAHKKNNIYCSRKCKDVAYKRSIGQDSSLNGWMRVCGVCGKEFCAKYYSQLTCSDECSKERERERQREKDRKKCKYTLTEYKKIVKIQARHNAEIKAAEKEKYIEEHTTQRECQYCGALFYCLDTSSQKTCSKECSRKYGNLRRDKRIPKEQIVDTDISIRKLFKRDKGKCWICGGECDFNSVSISAKGNKYPGENYPEVEHVIPISRGGLHSWDNVRLAHHRCNAIKSDQIYPYVSMDKEFAYKYKARTSCKRTAQYKKTGELVKIWDSTAQIRRELGLNDSQIQKVCRGEGKTAFGYRWAYV